MGRRLAMGLIIGTVAWSALSVLAATGAAADSPIGVTPYSGYNSTLTRAPYVTDLTQASAYVNWATTSKTPGSVKVAAAPNGACPGSISSWDSSARPVPTSLPGPVNPTTSGSSSTMTGWAFTVTNGAAAATSEYQSSVDVTGLSPSTTYCYAVFSSDQAGASDLLPGSQPYQTFTTLDPANTASTQPLTFDVMADTGENYAYTTATTATDLPFPGGINPDQAAIDKEIGATVPADGAKFLVLAGDVAYSGGNDSNYGDLEQTGTQPEVSTIFGPSYFPQTGGIPTFTADGNHGQNVTGLRVWPTPTTAAASGGTYAFDSYSGTDGISGTFPDDWYAFSSGNVRIYVLDGAWADGSSGPTGTGSATGSLCPTPAYCQGYQADADEHWQTSSPEYRWLQNDLAAHPGGIKFAVFHYPLRSVNATQPSDPYVQDSSANPNASTSLEALLARNGVDIAFNGHAHTYQRIVPDQSGQIINYVTGGGGGVPEPVVGGSCSSLQSTASVYAIGWSPSSTDSTTGTGSGCGAPAPGSAADVYNFLRVTVTGDTVTVTPTDAAGGTFDQKTYTFHPAPAPGAPSGGAPPPNGTSSPTPSACKTHLPSGAVVAAAASAGGAGYFETDTQGDVAAFGAATCHGAMTGVRLNRPIVGMAVDPATGGYWLVASDGGIFSFDAPFLGSTGGIRLNQPIVGMAADPATGGYWLVASDGGIFSFGAPFLGSTGSLRLNKPVVGMAADPATGGYWLVATDGGVFSFHAPFHGSTGSIRLNKPIVAIAPTSSGSGYRIVASDGGVFCFNAPFFGSAGNVPLVRPVIAGLNDDATGGYWLVASDGGVFSYRAPFLGSAA